MLKTLIPLQRLSNFLTPDDANCLAKCEIKNLFCYDWTFEVINSKTDAGKSCYAFQLRAESILGSEDKDDVLRAKCCLVLDRDHREKPIETYSTHNGGCQILRKIEPHLVNLHSVIFGLELTFFEIHGYDCLPQPAEKPYPNRVKLNIGGVVFKTTKETLTKYIGTFKVYLEIETFIRSCRDTNGEIFEDRSPKHFDTILNFMRDDVLELPKSDEEIRELLREAKYYLMPDLIELCSEHLESKKPSSSASLSSSETIEIISLNIGGTTFQTTKATLTRFNGKFSEMLENDTLTKTDNTIFIDRSPKHFDLILNYMRDGDVELPEGRRELKEILKEAQHYCLSELIDECQSLLNNIN
ncbi:unnamed protein product [Caenorhabditis brenneri]